MPNYQLGKIYTIRCRTDDTLIYVGSTIQPLSVRWGEHKRHSKKETFKNWLVYKTINGEWDNWYIELYENYACENREQLFRKEGQIIRLIGNLNTFIAGRTDKEYREDNKEKLNEKSKTYRKNNKEYWSEYSKKYRENNKDKLKEKITCECGCLISKVDISRHRKSPKHLKLINTTAN